MKFTNIFKYFCFFKQVTHSMNIPIFRNTVPEPLLAGTLLMQPPCKYCYCKYGNPVNMVALSTVDVRFSHQLILYTSGLASAHQCCYSRYMGSESLTPGCVASKRNSIIYVSKNKNVFLQCRLHGGEKSKSSLKR